MKKLSLALLLALSVNAQAYEPLNSVAALVDNTIITAQEVEARMQQVRAQGHSLPPAPILREQVLNHLIAERAQLQRAKETGIRVDQPTIDGAIAQIAQDHKLTVTELRKQVEADGLSFEEFREQVRDEIMLGRLYQRDVGSTIHVTDREIDHFLASAEGQMHMGVEYHLRHILISLPQDPSPEDIAEGQAQADALLARLNDGEDFSTLAVAHSRGQQALEGGDLGWRKAAALPALFADRVQALGSGQVMGPLRNASGFHLVQLVDKRIPEEKKALQTVHVRHLLLKPSAASSEEQVLERLEDFRTLLNNGTVSFEQLAQDHSEDMATAHKGGDLGWIMPDQVPESFLMTLHSAESGSVSEPIQSPFGWHLVQVLDRQAPEAAREPREQVRELLHTRKFDERLENYKRQLLAEAYIVVNTP